MKNAEFQLRGVGDPRLAVYATSSLPAWLWSMDGKRILWGNPPGARVFEARNAAALAAKNFGPANPHRRQVTRLAGRLLPNGALRMERLQGFGAPLGGLMTCACARLEFSDGGAGVLVVATKPSGPAMTLAERLESLVEAIDAPVAAFTRDGRFAAASEAAYALLDFPSLSAAGLDTARSHALAQGRAETPVGIGHLVLRRVGTGADVALVALLDPAPAKAATVASAAGTTPSPPPEPAVGNQTQDDKTLGDETSGDEIKNYEAPATTGEAPAEFALIDALSEPADDAIAGDDEDAEEIEGANRSGPTTMPDEEPEMTLLDAGEHEPSPLVEAVADETLWGSTADAFPAAGPFAIESETAADSAATPSRAADPSGPDSSVADLSGSDLPPPAWQAPLRFIWQMDADGRFSLHSDEFSRLIGARTAAAFGRPWNEIARLFALDPEGRLNRAVATREIWTGVALDWPADGGGPLPVELSGLPLYGRERRFAGYRGFGVCRDLDELTRLTLLRRQERVNAPPPEAPDLASDFSQKFSRDFLEDLPPLPPSWATREPEPEPEPEPERIWAPRSLSADIAHNAAMLSYSDVPLPSGPAPIVPEVFSPSEPDTQVETPKNVLPFRPVSETKPSETKPSLSLVENNAFNELARQLATRLEAEKSAEKSILARQPDRDSPTLADPETVAVPDDAPAWLAAPAPPARGEAQRDKALLDLLPVGILIYRLDRLLYANPAFLDRIGYANLQALEEADGLDALFVEPVALKGSSTSGSGTAVTIAATPAAADRAPLPPTEARLFSISWDGEPALALICSQTGVEAAPAAAIAAALAVPATAGETLSGQASADPAPAAGAEAPDALPDTAAESALRDPPPWQDDAAELSRATRPERSAQLRAQASSDMLARISHEIRTPLNAIIGFAEVMIEERFGTLGNERYVEYMKDIRGCGERVIAIVNDLLDLSRIESGNIDLDFGDQNLNELVESCVAAMQPQANRERIIIRSSLAHLLPGVVADARALRQIALNLLGSSIHLANAGGQVIVSTALSDSGEVVLRVRDTGHGLNEEELAAALAPFRVDQTSDACGISLSLTKALVEANRAQFQIKSAPHSGTLIEVVFSHAARA
jgi:signal transduction histidine kinase